MNGRWLLGALCAALVLLAIAQRTEFSVALASTSISGYQQDKVFKYEAGGVQFTVPAGWDVEKNKDGGVDVSGKDGDGYFVLSMTTLLPESATLTMEEQFKFFAQGILSSVKKDLKGFSLPYRRAGKLKETAIEP